MPWFYTFGVAGLLRIYIGFQKMIKDCEKGKIDYVVTKSISRFARNTLNTLENIRKLKELGIVPRDVFYYIQELTHNRRSSKRRMRTILHGLVVCGECGSR